MAHQNDPALGINSWLEDELQTQYQFDRKSVDEGWVSFFKQSEATDRSEAPGRTANQFTPGVAMVRTVESPLRSIRL